MAGCAMDQHRTHSQQNPAKVEQKKTSRLSGPGAKVSWRWSEDRRTGACVTSTKSEIMSLPGLAELAIVIVSFSIVAAYLFVVRRFLKRAEEAPSKSRQNERT